MRRLRVASALALVAWTLALVGGTPASAECASAEATSSACEGEQGQTVATLRAVVAAHRGSSYKRPGYSSLKLVSMPEAAYLTASEPRTRTHLQWLTADRESNVVTVPWDCRRPGQTFHFALTARGNVGATVTATVTFHAQLGTRWCAAAKAREEAQRLAAKRRHEAEVREAQRREAEHREAERREVENREATSTCTNGTYVNSAGNTVCKPEESPTGTAPAGATAECEDGTFSFSESRSGTCSHHGGVAEWL
jgi:Protein of unknown function (DUF3761)